MKVLISPHFNSAMLRLDAAAQKETSQFFSLASALTREQLFESPLVTKLNTSEEIFTLRGTFVRIFATLDANGDIIFLDVRHVGVPPVRPEVPKNGEVTLFGKSGDPQAYIAYRDESTIYSFSGEPLAYVDEKSNIYGFNGAHLGWFEDDIVWDHQGRRVGNTAKSCPALRKFEPFKGFKRFKPFKGFKRIPPLKPLKSHLQSGLSLLEFLQGGRK